MLAEAIDANSVTIAGPTLVAFVSGSLEVTQGQKFSADVSATKDGSNSWRMVVMANRKGSSKVATDFIAKIGDNTSMFCPTALGNEVGIPTPDELNFFFEAVFTIDVNGTPTNTAPIYLGQGHSALGTNNWWIGGADVYVTHFPTRYGQTGYNTATLTVSGFQQNLTGEVSSFALT